MKGDRDGDLTVLHEPCLPRLGHVARGALDAHRVNLALPSAMREDASEDLFLISASHERLR
jgi:hypothetical protein